MPAPRLLYAHGFASGPRSTKGVAIAEHLARRGLGLRLLDMRVPEPSHPRLASMINELRWAIQLKESIQHGTIVPVARISFAMRSKCSRLMMCSSRKATRAMLSSVITIARPEKMAPATK